MSRVTSSALARLGVKRCAYVCGRAPAPERLKALSDSRYPSLRAASPPPRAPLTVCSLSCCVSARTRHVPRRVLKAELGRAEEERRAQGIRPALGVVRFCSLSLSRGLGHRSSWAQPRAAAAAGFISPGSVPALSSSEGLRGPRGMGGGGSGEPRLVPASFCAIKTAGKTGFFQCPCPYPFPRSPSSHPRAITGGGEGHGSGVALKEKH